MLDVATSIGMSLHQVWFIVSALHKTYVFVFTMIPSQSSNRTSFDKTEHSFYSLYVSALTSTDHGPNIIVIENMFGSSSVQILDSLGSRVTATNELVCVFRRRDHPLPTNSDSNNHAHVTWVLSISNIRY